MTNYPIDFRYSGADGSSSLGYAPSPEEAVELITADGQAYQRSEWKNVSVSRRETEVGSTMKHKADVQEAWASEIELGYASPRQVYGGWIVIIEYYDVSAEEV